jgi:hypothetical protein
VTNVVRHAYGRRDGRVDIVVERDEEELTIVVRDAGVGMPPPSRRQTSGGFGLKIIGELARENTISRSPEGGTEVAMVFDLDREPARAADGQTRVIYNGHVLPQAVNKGDRRLVVAKGHESPGAVIQSATVNTPVGFIDPELSDCIVKDLPQRLIVCNRHGDALPVEPRSSVLVVVVEAPLKALGAVGQELAGVAPHASDFNLGHARIVADCGRMTRALAPRVAPHFSAR